MDKKLKGDKTNMFFKKKTVEDILSEIEKLDEAERARLLETLSGGADEAVEEEPQETPETEPQTGETPTDGQTDEPTAESPAEGEQTPETEREESAETAEAEPPEEEPTEENAQTEEPPVSEEPIPEEPPAEEPSAGPVPPEPIPTEDKSKELIEAQTARIDALESQLSAMKELLDNIVTNQDNQNFGMSPQADFSDDARSLRTSAVLQGYAGRRANDYK